MSDNKFVKGEVITAAKLNRIVDALPGLGTPSRPGRQFAALFLTPSGGIPGRSGSTLGAANCQRVTKEGLTLATATSQTERVCNLSTEDVGGSVYVQALWIDGDWIANWEECE
jgi:hypothetical protein